MSRRRMIGFAEGWRVKEYEYRCAEYEFEPNILRDLLKPHNTPHEFSITSPNRQQLQKVRVAHTTIPVEISLARIAR